jgi:hypothetical protein
MKRQQLVTHKVEDIPDGFVTLSSFGSHSPTRRATREYALLSDAWQNGSLGGWKLMSSPKDKGGPVYVNKHEADELVCRLIGERDSVEAQDQSSSPPQSDVLPQKEEQTQRAECAQIDDSIAYHAADIRISLARCVACLGDIYDAIETVARATEATARAVEELATKPTTERTTTHQ